MLNGVVRSESGLGVAPPPMMGPGGQEDAMGWKVIPEPAHDRVTAVFEGQSLDAEAGEASAAAFREAFPGRPLDVCWDVTHMTGFDGGPARPGPRRSVGPGANQEPPR